MDLPESRRVWKSCLHVSQEPWLCFLAVCGWVSWEAGQCCECGSGPWDVYSPCNLHEPVRKKAAPLGRNKAMGTRLCNRVLLAGFLGPPCPLGQYFWAAQKLYHESQLPYREERSCCPQKPERYGEGSGEWRTLPCPALRPGPYTPGQARG